MDSKKLILIAVLMGLTAVLLAVAPSDATDDEFDCEVAYSNGVISISGEIPDGYIWDETNIEIEVQMADGGKIASAYALPNSVGRFSENISCSLSPGTYNILLGLTSTGKMTIPMTKSLVVSDTSQVIPVTSISVKPESKQMVIGDETVLHCDIDPLTATDKKVTWYTSKPSVASVDEFGKVTALSVGSTTITARVAGGIESHCTITVVQQSTPSSSSTASISPERSPVTVYKGLTLGVKIALVGCTISEVEVQSSNTQIVTTESRISQNGELVITGVDVGSTTVQLTAPGKAVAKFTVRVEENPGVPCDIYYFYIKLKETDMNGQSITGISDADARAGFWVKGFGSTAQDALRYVASKNGWDLTFNEAYYQGWIETFLGLNQLSHTNGAWTYWVQYHWEGNRWVGNDYCLGYLTTTDYQYLALVYDTTEVSIEPTSLGVSPNDIPSYVRNQVRDSGGSSGDSGNVEPSVPVTPDKPVTPSEHLDPTDPDVTVENDTVENADGTTTEVQTITKTEEDGTITTTVISTTAQTDGTVEEIKSTSHAQTSEDGVKTESSLDTVTVTDSEGNVVSETNIEVSVVDTTDSSGTGSKGVTITAVDKDGEASVTTEYQEGSQSASVVTEVKVSEENGQTVVTDKALDTALMMQEMYSDRIVGGSVKDSDKTVQIGSSSGAPLVLSKDAVAAIADSGADLRFVSGDGSVIIPNVVLAGLSDEEEIEISVIYLEKADLEGAQKDAVSDDSTLVDITIVSGERNLGSDLGGMITVIVKHDSEDGKKVAAYYVAEDGSKEKVRSSYDSAKGEVSLYLTHCSVYEIADEEPSASSDEEDNTTLYIIIAVVAIAIIAVAAVMILRRH